MSYADYRAGIGSNPEHGGSVQHDSCEKAFIAGAEFSMPTDEQWEKITLKLLCLFKDSADTPMLSLDLMVKQIFTETKG